MTSQKRTMALINVLGGIAVLGSYAYCVTSYPGRVGDFWGGVPEGLRPVYTTNMFLAAAGYFAFSFFLWFRLEPSRHAFFGRDTFNALYALILLPSALWMPLTFAMLEAPGDGLWWAVRGVLAAVAVGSLGLLAGLVAVRPSTPSWAHRLAVVGSVAFCFQTAVLDAVVWPAYFLVPAS
jgi:hypothetical protein